MADSPLATAGTSYVNLALRPGGDPTGAADNARVLADALAEADAVYLPAGRWRFGRPVEITADHKRIFGEGEPTVLLPREMPAGSPALFVVGPQGLGRIVSGVTLERFSIQGFDYAPGESPAGIETRNADRVTVARVDFDDAGKKALRFGPHDGADGTEDGASRGHRALHVRVRGMHPRFAGDARSGIEISAADDVTLHGFDVRDCPLSHGVRITGARGTRLFDGRIRGCATGVSIQGLTDGTRVVRAPTGWDVESVDVGGCSGAGFELFHGASHGRIRGCTVRDARRGVHAGQAVPAGADPADYPGAHDFVLDDLLIHGNEQPFTFTVAAAGEAPAETSVSMLQGVLLADVSNVSIHRLRAFGIGGAAATFGVRFDRAGGLNVVTDMEYRAASPLGEAVQSRESRAGSTVMVRGGIFSNPLRRGGARQATLCRQPSGAGTFVVDANSYF